MRRRHISQELKGGLDEALETIPEQEGVIAWLWLQNSEALKEILSHWDKTWVALNPLILSVGQELWLDLQPEEGGGKMKRGF